MSTKLPALPNHKNLNLPNNYTYVNHKCGQYTKINGFLKLFLES